ncbi:MAG: type II secretion system protein, partial [Phycisphaerales bacterium]
ERRCAGVTLLELLVSVAIVGVILAIAIVAVRGALHAGRETRVVADAKSHAQMHQYWRADHDGVFLNVGVHHPTFRDRGRFESENTMVYLVSLTGSLLHLWYPQQAGYDTWRHVVQAWTGEPYGPLHSFEYGFAFFTDHRLWAPDNDPWTEWPAVQRFQFVREAQTAYPAGKGLLRRVLNERTTESDPLQDRFCIAFVDGSAGVHTHEDIVEPHAGFFGGDLTPLMQPVLYTVDGVAGRDVRR